MWHWAQPNTPCLSVQAPWSGQCRASVFWVFGVYTALTPVKSMALHCVCVTFLQVVSSPGTGPSMRETLRVSPSFLPGCSGCLRRDQWDHLPAGSYLHLTCAIFLALWHSKIFEAHLVLSLHWLRNQPFLQEPFEQLVEFKKPRSGGRCICYYSRCHCQANPTGRAGKCVCSCLQQAGCGLVWEVRSKWEGLASLAWGWCENSSLDIAAFRNLYVK